MKQLEIDDELNKGFRCHCCGQFVKMYTRPIYGAMVHGLIVMYRHGAADGYVHVPTLLARLKMNTADACTAKLKFWGLVTEKFNDNTKKRCSGFWKLTPLGVDFVLGRATVKEKIMLLQNKFQGFKGKDIYVREALGKYFDYNELMNS